jgi:PadR family transcriptional regulator AphA
MVRAHPDDLLLGEWACLGILYPGPAHGFAIAARLTPNADIGRVWSLSRPLTYRSLDQLTARDLVRPIGEEPGIAGGNRTVLTATRTGRAQFRRWVRTPVEHLRDLRSELLLKILLADQAELDITETLAAQREHITAFVDAFETDSGDGTSDIVRLWRLESARAALRFLDRLAPPAPPSDR